MLIAVPRRAVTEPALGLHRRRSSIAFVELFALGMFLGRVSRQRLVWSGMKLAVAGVLCLVLSALLDCGLR